MEVFFDIDVFDGDVISMMFLSPYGYFYAEPTNTGMQSDSLRFKDKVFYLNADPEHNEIEIKESFDNIIKGLNAWLSKGDNKSFITYQDQSDKIKLMKDLLGIDPSDFNDSGIKLNDDPNIDISDRVHKLRDNYEIINKQ